MADARFLDDMEKRGLVAQVVKPDELRALAAKEVVTVYAGFDPTAESLHVGSMIPALALARFQRSGHRPIALIGGGTGLIGDPSGKQKERTLLTKEQVAANCAGIRAQLERFLDFSPGPSGARLVDNGEWLCSVPLLDFLRDVGKHFSVNEMVTRDSVKNRLEAQGISFTEFSYMLLQSYDFLVLHDRLGCRLQTGGSDQYGNIVSGVDLIRRMRGVEAFGLTYPLLTKADGSKFGKSESSGNVWLDARLTSPFKMFQFWLRTDDRNVGRFLRWFTFLPLDEIDSLERETAANPERRAGHTALAREMTRFVHGAQALASAERATAVLFGKGDLRDLDAAQILDVFDDVPAKEVARSRLEGEGARLLELAVETGLCPSMGMAKKDLAAGALYVNGAKAAGEARVTTKDLIDGRVVVLRRGKKDNLVVKAV